MERLAAIGSLSAHQGNFQHCVRTRLLHKCCQFVVKACEGHARLSWLPVGLPVQELVFSPACAPPAPLHLPGDLFRSVKPYFQCAMEASSLTGGLGSSVIRANDCASDRQAATSSEPSVPTTDRLNRTCAAAKLMLTEAATPASKTRPPTSVSGEGSSEFAWELCAHAWRASPAPARHG